MKLGIENIIAPVMVIFLVTSGCGRISDTQSDPEAYRAELEAWRNNRITRLKSPEGWLNVAGLYWLHEGSNTFGSDTANDIVFPPKAPAFTGIIELLGDSVFLRTTFVPVCVDSVPVDNIVLKNDASDAPDIMTTGSFAWHIIKRGDRYGIRLRDFKNPMIDSLANIPCFETGEKWKVTAEYMPYETPEKHMVQNIIGTEEENMVPGELNFKINGKKCTLYPFTSGDGLFIVFGDKTNGDETYPAGRFLYASGPDENNQVVIDFNKAYNPPCAFTPYATCPLPLRQNVLPVKIEAGEKTVHLFNF